MNKQVSGGSEALRVDALDRLGHPAAHARFKPVIDFARQYSKNKLGVVGLVGLVLFGATALLAGVLSPYSPIQTNQTRQARLQDPSRAHPLGTDFLGRDELSRVMHGSRVSFKIAFVAVSVAIVLGVPLGIVAGYVGGWVDEVLIMRVMDALMAFPSIILLLAMAAAVGPSLTNSMIIIGVVFAPGYARLARGQVLSLKQQPFIDGAIAVGATPLRVMARHIAPNLVAPIIVLGSLSAGGVILTEASLSFLGVGIRPPTPAWGSMLAEGYGSLRSSPWPIIAPGVAIGLLVLCFNFVGDALRDALDPRLRGRL